MRKPARKSSPATILRAVVAFAALLLLAALVLAVGRPMGDRFVTLAGDALYVLGALFATSTGVYAFAYFTSWTPQGRIQGLLAAGMLLNALAGMMLLYYEAALGAYPYPSLADAVWLFAFIPQCIALWYGWYRTRGQADGIKTLGFIASWLLLTAVTLVSLIIPIAQDPAVSLLPKLFNVAYPTMNLIIILLTGVLTMALWGGAFTAPWGLLFAGVFSLAWGDLSFSYLSWKGIYATGHVTDLFWTIGFCLIALGFVYQRRVVESPRRR